MSIWWDGPPTPPPPRLEIPFIPALPVFIIIYGTPDGQRWPIMMCLN